MKKSELKLKSHAILHGEEAVEIWYQGVLIASVYGADGPGVRVVSKYPMDVVRGGLGPEISVIEVRMEI